MKLVWCEESLYTSNAALRALVDTLMFFQGYTSLIRAFSNGRLPVAELLIGAKADVNAKNVCKKNYDFWACLSEFRNQFLFEVAYACLLVLVFFMCCDNVFLLHSALGLGI